MSYIVRVVRFIKKYSVAHPRFFGTYVWYYFSPRFLPTVSFLEPKALLELLQAGKSFIRFGDGEIYLLNGGTMGYEASTPRIRTMFQKIIRSYTKNAPYVLGINEGPLTTTNADLKKIGLLHCWLPLKSYYQAFFPKDIAYLDSSIFYFNEMIPLYVEPYLKGKAVVIVTRQQTIESIKNNPTIPFTDIQYVETPDTYTSRVYDTIYESVKALLMANQKPTVVLVACGPMSKIMVYDLAEVGYQAIDIGIGIELMYTDTDKSYMVTPAPAYRLLSASSK